MKIIVRNTAGLLDGWKSSPSNWCGLSDDTSDVLKCIVARSFALDFWQRLLALVLRRQGDGIHSRACARLSMAMNSRGRESLTSSLYLLVFLYWQVCTTYNLAVIECLINFYIIQSSSLQWFYWSLFDALSFHLVLYLANRKITVSKVSLLGNYMSAWHLTATKKIVLIRGGQIRCVLVDSDSFVDFNK